MVTVNERLSNAYESSDMSTSSREKVIKRLFGFMLFVERRKIESKYRMLVSRYILRKSLHAYGAMTIASSAMRVYSPYLI